MSSFNSPAAITTTVTSGIWELKNFNRIAAKEFSSPAFGPEKFSWTMQMHPKGTGAGMGTHISLFLNAQLAGYGAPPPREGVFYELFMYMSSDCSTPVHSEKFKYDSAATRNGSHTFFLHSALDIVPTASLYFRAYITDVPTSQEVKCDSLGQSLLDSAPLDGDVWIRGMEDTDDNVTAGNRVFAHRLVLGRDPWFKAAFALNGQNSASEKKASGDPRLLCPIDLTDYDRSVLLGLLEWLYIGDIVEWMPRTLQGQFSLLRCAEYLVNRPLFRFMSKHLAKRQYGPEVILDLMLGRSDPLSTLIESEADSGELGYSSSEDEDGLARSDYAIYPYVALAPPTRPLKRGRYS